MDAKTILILNTIYAVIVSVFIIAGIMIQNKNIPYRKWSIAFVLFTLNFSILSLRDGFPIVIVGVLPHVFTFIAFALIKSGLMDTLNIKENKKVDRILVLLGTLGVLYFYNVTNMKAYIVILTQGFLIFETWIICYKEKNIDAIKRRIILWTFGFSIMIQAIRFIISIPWASQLNPLNKGSGLSYMSVLFFIIYIFMTLTIISIILRKRVIEQKLLIEELMQITLYDKLTGIYNRRGFHQLFDYEYKLKKRESTPSGYVVAICDVDDFKSINDTYGHDVGDRVLKNIAQKITEATRETDIVARWGGEEFLIYISNVDEVNGEVVINKILKTIQNSKILYKRKKIKATISIGALYTRGVLYKLDDLISASDKELYKAKNNGKNQIKYKVMIDVCANLKSGQLVH